MFRLALLATVALAWSSAPAKAQEAMNHASVAGRVLDPSGAVVAAASVLARDIGTNVRAATTSDTEGRFRLPYLRPGQYELTISARGFAPLKRSLTLAAGAAFDLPLELTPGAAEAVTVVGSTPLVDTARSQIATALPRAEVQALPMNGRNFLDLALLAPGVSPTNVGGGTQLFPETSAVPGVGLSVSSQRNLSNNFMIDGLSANDDAAALSGLSLSIDAIGQVQVVTSGGQAELGRALGGHVNLATRSGTNQWQGDGFAFFRDDSMNARNRLSGTKLPMQQQQYGGSAGGPLVRNRTFFFANIERRDLDQTGLTTIPTATVAAINSRLGAMGYGGPALATGVYANPIDTLHGLAKVDHHLGAAQLSFRYSAYGVDSRNARGAGGTAAPSASAGLDNLDQTGAMSAIFGLSSRTILELRGQLSRGDLDALPADAVGPAVSISGVASFGRLSTSPTGRVGTMVQTIANVMHQRGAHAFRAGIDVLHNDVTIEFPRAVNGSYAFSSLANFLSGQYNTSGFTQTFGATSVALSNPNAGWFVQDEWRVGSHVTVNAGLRYDLQCLETVETDRNNVSPRLGIAWSPAASRRTVVRGSAGRFYDRVPLRALANALLSAGNTTDVTALRQTSVSLSPAQTGAPVFPAILPGIVPTTTLVNFTTMDRALQNAHSNQAGVEIEQQVGSLMTVSASYQRLRGHELLMQINQNVPTCAAAGGNNGCRPDPAFANNNQYRAAGSSEYDGLHFSVIKRASGWNAWRVSYTWSRSMNNLGETFFAAPFDPTDLSKDWGRSDDDQRHRLTVSGALTIPRAAVASWWRRAIDELQLSGLLQAYSSLPYTVTTGATTIQGTPARPLLNGAPLGRNTGEGTPFSTVSLRLSKPVRVGARVTVDLLGEAFNVFDRRNDLARVTVFGAGTYPSSPAANFGHVTVVGEPRSLQVGVRVRY